VKSLDNNIRIFRYFSLLIILTLVCAVVVFGCIYWYSTISTYNFFLLIVILLTIIIMVAFILAVVIVIHAYRKKYVSSVLLWPVRTALRIVYPFVAFITGFFKGDKDAIRRIYVEVNNIIVESHRGKYKPDEVLVLLPHCLQDSECRYKLTNDISNCHQCGKCSIGDIVNVTSPMGLQAKVVTGGTAARNIVKEYKPGIILSVACERDLASGIADVASTPVIGIFNKRPNGPCHNTMLDISVFREKLKRIIDD
jgi:hypothetical protein